MKPFKAGRWTLEREGDHWRFYGTTNMMKDDDLRHIKALCEKALAHRKAKAVKW